MRKYKFIVCAFCLVSLLLTCSGAVLAIGFNAEQVYNSIFVVYSGNSLGSGFAISENCIIRNAHVIDNRNDVEIATYSREYHSASIIAMDEDLDIAVLQVDNTSFPYLKSADYHNANIGEDVYAVGAPNSMAYTLTKGVLSAKERTYGNYKYLQIDAAINTGNSGGPLLNDKGEVLGINTLKMTDSEGIGLSIPMTTVYDFLKSNGIEVDDQGNIIGILKKDADTSNNNKKNTGNNASKPVDISKYKIENFTLKLILAFSVLLNIVLLILFLCTRKKKEKVNKVPDNQFDFEIDILE